MSSRARSRIVSELAVRAVVAVLLLAFNELFGVGPNPRGDIALRTLGILTLLLNIPYYVIARTGWRLRVQAYVRMLVDITLVTAGIYDAGGLAAAQDLSVYVIIPVYAALMLSSTAALVATAYATVAFIAVVVAQALGWLPTFRPPLPNALGVTAFNLGVVNVVAVMTAWLSLQYRRSRRQVTELNRELERAHDASLRLAGEIQRTSRLDALGEVVAGITHEMRNVIMAAISHVHLLRRRLTDADAETRRHVDQVEYSLTSAARILGNVLETARQPSSERGPVSIPDIVRRVVDLKGYDVRRDGITLRVDFPSPFPPVIASAFQLEQVILNLVSNAHEALRGARRGGAIMIAGVVDDGKAVVEVRDDGPGIPSDALPRIFEPFYTTKSSGTGLGLAISAGIVRDAGGELTARNRSGGGAVFRLAFPVASS
ncbi:MAG TPA: ATP-binding protein [Methylomirabilota bacterium]|nr:ATP-binding protein [Methylomirabilota bacterium]